MLSKKQRLAGSALPLLKSQGKTKPGEDFTLIYLANNLGLPRFGLIISKKIDKRAVARNRVKRVFYQAIQDNLDKFTPADYLFLVKRSVLGKTVDQLSQQLVSCLGKTD